MHNHRRLFLVFLIFLLILSGTVAQTDEVEPIEIEQGFGAAKGFWRVFFTAPTGSSDEADYEGGIDLQLIADIESAERTLDIAAFEWNNPRITQAVVDAHERGVQVRMVVDDEHTIEEYEDAVFFEEETPFADIVDTGISYVDDDRGALMHNKFMVIDGRVIWMGSMNYTINGTYRNNNNMLSLRSRLAASIYQNEFEEMFTYEEFGPTSTTEGDIRFEIEGTPVHILFASENDVVMPLIETVSSARKSIRFMAFSFTLDELGVAMIERAYSGVEVQGIFETRGSETSFSEMPRGYCAGLDYRQDGNPYTFHHKVIIIDDEIVVTGSFNFSNNATSSNDENLIIIKDADLAAQYTTEFNRQWAIAEYPEDEDVGCDSTSRVASPWMTDSSEFMCPSVTATCSQLSCSQAFACLGEGNTSLDGDGDGIPCASVCSGIK